VGEAVNAAVPPVVAARIIAGLVSEPGYRDAILGDLEEEFAEYCERVGVSDARRWYWWQTLQAIVPLARSRPWSFAAGIRVLVSVTAIYVILLQAIGLESLVALRFVPSSAPFQVRFVLLACIFLGGLIAGCIIVRILPREPVIGGLLLVAIAVGIGVYHIGSGSRAEAIFRAAKVVTLMCTLSIGSLVTLSRQQYGGSRSSSVKRS
jgi:hypothetical protein